MIRGKCEQYLSEDGSYKLINISANALPAYLAHGDGQPGGSFPGMEDYEFSETCEAVALFSLTIPAIISPENGSVIASTDLTKVDWTDSTGTYMPITYKYLAYGDSDYTSVIYSSVWLTDSEIPTPGIPAGVYYLRVKAKDNMGNESDWSNGASNSYMVTVVNPEPVLLKTVTVDPSSTSGNSSTNVLENDKNYLFEVSGTYTNRNGSEQVDAEYVSEDNWVTKYDGLSGRPVTNYWNLLDLQVNNTFIDWLELNPVLANTYHYSMAGNGSAVNFRVF